jgi:hypothetical protein
MPAEAWVALVLGVLGIMGSIGVTAWYLGSMLSKQDTEMSGIKTAIDKIEVVISSIAVDRDRAASLERRVAKLEQWYDELRRGVGRIVTEPSRTATM